MSIWKSYIRRDMENSNISTEIARTLKKTPNIWGFGGESSDV